MWKPEDLDFHFGSTPLACKFSSEDLVLDLLLGAHEHQRILGASGLLEGHLIHSSVLGGTRSKLS